MALGEMTINYLSFLQEQASFMCFRERYPKGVPSTMEE